MYEFKQLNTLNYYLTRSFEYISNGRMQTLEQRKEVDDNYKSLITENQIEYFELKVGISNVDKIVSDILNILESSKMINQIFNENNIQTMQSND
jgi:hypothetical protein